MATIVVEDDARPIARVLAHVLRRSAADAELGPVMDALDGVLALQSATDPQRASIHFRSGDVYVEGGLSPDADVTLTVDFDAPTGPDAPRPSVRDLARLAKAAARRPVFAQNAAKVLEPPLPDWREAAAGFWQVVERRGGGPSGLRIVCTDDEGHSELVLGDGRDPMQLFGPARLLSRCLVGEAVLAEEVIEGRLRAVGGLGELSLLTGHALAVMLGE